MPENAQSQSTQAYLLLESLIVTLKLKPGALVTEKQLIELTGCGRTPVREAIQRLEWQGLIIVRPRAGLQIAALNPEHYGMILETRRQLEPLAARMVAARMTASMRKALIGCAKAMTECSLTGDTEKFLAADKTFDQILEENCPNPFIIQALAPLQTHSRRFWYFGASAAGLAKSVNLHVDVIRAMLQQDPDQAAKSMLVLLDGLSAMVTDR